MYEGYRMYLFCLQEGIKGILHSPEMKEIAYDWSLNLSGFSGSNIVWTLERRPAR
jgi:hypothetical protein